MEIFTELARIFEPASIIISFGIMVFIIAYISNVLIKKRPKGKIIICLGALFAIILLLYPYFYRAYPTDTFTYILKALITLPLLFFVPGYVMVNAFLKDKELSFLEVIFIQIFASILISGWIGLTIAELGHFSLLYLLALVILISGLLAWKYDVRFDLNLYPKPTLNHFSLILVIILIVGVMVFFQPMFTNFGADDGILVPQAVNIAETGSLIAHDSILENMEGPARSTFYQSVDRWYFRGQCEYLQFPIYGFYVDSGNIIRFQYFDFFPILLAIFYSLFSVENFLYINSFIAILTIVCIFVVARRLFNTQVAVLSALFLTINFAQIFFARYPGAEILTQLLIFGGLFTTMLMIKTNKPFYGILSAFAFSGCLLTRIDALLLYVPLILLLFLLIVTENIRKEHLFFFIPFLILNVLVWLHLYLFDLPYFISQFRVIGHEISYLAYSLLLVAMLSITIVISLLLRRYRYVIGRLISQLKSHTEALTLANSILFGSIFVYLYFIRPQLDPNIVTGGSILLLEQAVTIVGLLLAIYGFVELINTRIIAPQKMGRVGIITLFFLLIGICYTIVYLINLKNSPVQPWLFRRYITVSIPFLIMLMSYGTTKIVGINYNHQFLKSAYILIVLFLVVSFSYTSITTSFIGIPITNNSENIVLQTKNLANNFDDKDIVIITGSKWRSQGGPSIILKYIFNKNTIVLPPEVYKKEESGPILLMQISHWLREGRNVYLASSSPDFLIHFSDFNNLKLNHTSKTDIHSSSTTVYTTFDIFKIQYTKHKHRYLITPNKLPLIVRKYGSVNNITKIVQFQHPTSQIQHDVLIPRNATLKFSIALDPRVWSPEKGDGVNFDIYLKEKESEILLFSKYIDPKNNPKDRKWNNSEVGLSHWKNKNVTIIFATSPGPNNDSTCDWAWWGEPRIACG